jgi:hypothetical protein
MRSRKPKTAVKAVRRPRRRGPPMGAMPMPMARPMPPPMMGAGGPPPGAGPPMPSMKRGGTVKKTGPHKLHKGEKVVPKGKKRE